MKVITTNVSLVIHYVASNIVLPVSPTSLLSKKPLNDPEQHCAIHDHFGWTYAYFGHAVYVVGLCPHLICVVFL